MRIRLIHNPHVVSASQLRELLPEGVADHEYEIQATVSAADVRQRAREAIDRGFDRLVIAGGDGSAGTAINGIAPDFSAIELAVLPFGTGNDLARSLGLNPELPGLACSYAFGTQVEAIDLVRLSGTATSYCVNVANGGFGGRVAADVRVSDKQRWGALAYWITSFIDLVELQTFEIELALDDNPTLIIPTLGVAIANGRFVGGGFPIAPQAVLNDGLLDIIVVPVLAPFDLMTAGLSFSLGFDQLDDGVRTYRAQRVRLGSVPRMPFSVDGESSDCSEMIFEIVPRALRVVIGDFPAALNISNPEGSIR